MSKKHGFNQEDLWKELAKGLEEITTENTSEVKPDLLQAGIEMKKLFDSFVEAGFTGEQAIRLLAEIVARGGEK